MKRTDPRRARALISSGVIVLLTAVGTVVSLTSKSKGLLTSYGLENLKYFTVDSNLLLGLACLLELVLAAAGRAPAWMDTLRYLATVAVSLTFTVVAVFFGPFVGYAPLYRDGNLFFHLLVPAVGILSFCVLRRGRFIPLRETGLAVLPSVAYGLYYTAVLLRRGVHFPDTDWYGFAAGGVVGSVLTAAAVFLLTWVLALLLRLASGGTKRRISESERA